MARHIIKLGTGIVAHNNGTPRTDTLTHICDEIARRHHAGDEIIVVSSGAIARGINALGLSKRPTAIEDLQAASAIGQGRLYRAYDELLAARQVTAAQVLLTFFDLNHTGQLHNARQTLHRLLDWRAVPIINENDTTATDEITFGDNDFLAAQVAILMDADQLVLLTGVDGVLTSDPATDPNARVVREVTSLATLEEFAAVTDSTSALGSGGMRSKVSAAGVAAGAGIPAVICNGLRPGALRRVLEGGTDEGTRFAPHVVV